MTQALPILASCAALLAPLAGQKPANQHAEARAEAHAEAHADGRGGVPGSRDVHSATHRVVVENGRTVVDARTVDGKPVPAGAAPPAQPAQPPLPVDPAELLRRLREQVERAVDAGSPPAPTPPPGPTPAQARGKLTPRRAAR